MRLVKNLPQGSPEPEALTKTAERLLREIREDANLRRYDVQRGAESPESAARLFERYGHGLAKASGMCGDRIAANALMDEIDRLAVLIDPHALQNRQHRLRSRTEHRYFVVPDPAAE